ncbi:MAG TPA: hypothetical protein V6C69_19220 [Trichormus sp.]
MKKRINMQAVLALTAMSTVLTSWTGGVSARNNNNNNNNNRGPAPAPQRQDQGAQRAQQEQQQRAFQQQMQQQQESRRNQEQQARQQEEQARNNQQQAMRSQQEAAQRQQQEIGRQQQEAGQRQAQEMQRQQQEAGQRQAQEMQRQQQESARNQEKQQEQMQRQQEQAQRQQQEQAQRQQKEAERQPQNEMRQQQNNPPREMEAQQREQKNEAKNAERNRPEERTAFGAPPNEIHGLPGRFNPGTGLRPVTPRPFNMPQVKIDKAHSMPVLEGNLSAEEREHANLVNQNLTAHLYAVAANQAPPTFGETQNYWHNTYFNNYPINWNNQTAYLTPQNCFVNVVQPNQWPYWYNAQPGWQYCNGFSLGNVVNVAANWLGFGWHPYYGPQPDGFVCATNYFPTLWTYVPAYGLWRVAGEQGWAPSGPPYDYTGPISVQVWEPRHVNVRDPYTGWATKRVVNVIYMYNAFFFPDMERWGYTNRHGYFVWLNL